MQGKLWASLTLAAIVAVPSGALARNHKNVLAPMAVPSQLADLVVAAPLISLPTVPMREVSLTGMVSSAGIGPRPSVLEPLKRLSCVPYARLRSGMQIFGDAKLWWGKARDLYAQIASPVSEAVMVFSGSDRLRRGHVAVVTQVISPREIKVDHANWQNHGEIDLNMPVLDVSRNNDWSQVRVWNVNTNSFGTHVYAVSGFITRDHVVNLAK